MAGHDSTNDGTAARAAQLETLRKRVMAVVGHELRTPVTTMRGLADAMLNAGTDEIHDEIAPAMVRLASRVEQLLDDLLVAADLSTVMPVGRPRPAPVVQSLRAAWADISGAGELEIDGDEGVLAIVPPSSLARMFAPLLDNAAKYGDGPVRVAVERTMGEVTVKIASDGPPVSSIDLALAFEPFYRGERAVTTAPGLGVGLAVCRALVEQAGGRVDVTNEDDDVVVATVTLPGQ